MLSDLFHKLELRAISMLQDAGFNAEYHHHMSSLARGVTVHVSKRDRRIEWVIERYIKTPIGFNYSEARRGFLLHAGSVNDVASTEALVTFVGQLAGAEPAAALREFLAQLLDSNSVTTTREDFERLPSALRTQAGSAWLAGQSA